MVVSLVSKVRSPLLSSLPRRREVWTGGESSTYDDMAELERISVPTLLVWGDADGVVTRELQDALASRIPGAELRIYEGVGHTPRWEDRARFAADVAAFVEGIVGEEL